MDQPILPPLYATPLEAIRGTEDQLALPAAERLDFVPGISPRRVWMSRLVPGAPLRLADGTADGTPRRLRVVS